MLTLPFLFRDNSSIHSWVKPLSMLGFSKPSRPENQGRGHLLPTNKDVFIKNNQAR